MAIQHAGLRGNARSGADGNQILELGEHLPDVLFLRAKIGIPRGGPAWNDPHVDGRIVGVAVRSHYGGVEGRVELVHGRAERCCADGVEGASQEGELEVGLPEEGLEDLQGPKTSSTEKVGGRRKP